MKSNDGLTETLKRVSCDVKRTVKQAQLPRVYQCMENICWGVILGMNSCTSLYFDLKELIERLKAT